MNICLLFLLTTTTAITATKCSELKILKEIVDSVIPKKAREFWIEEAVSEQDCTLMTLCKAGKVLEKFNAMNFGLKKAEWKLPRQLNTLQHSCTQPGKNATLVRLSKLLEEIRKCAIKQFSSGAR